MRPNLTNNSISCTLEFESQREAERFYFDLPSTSDRSLVGKRLHLCHERNRRIYLRLHRKIKRLVDRSKCKIIHEDRYIVRRG